VLLSFSVYYSLDLRESALWGVEIVESLRAEDRKQRLEGRAGQGRAGLRQCFPLRTLDILGG